MPRNVKRRRSARRGGSGGAGAPGSVSAGLIGWYDFNDISTLFQDTGRTTPITADAQVIKGVRDKSTAGNHLSEATNGPTYKVNIQNGKAVARFDGSNDQLGRTSFTGGTVAQPYTAVFAGRNSDNAEATSPWLDGGDGATRFHAAINNSPTTWGIFTGGSVQPYTTIPVSDTAHHLFGVVSNGAAWQGYIDGGPNRSNGSTPGSSSLNGIALCTNSFASGTTWAQIDFGELMLYNRALTTAEFDSVGQYLATKWGAGWLPTQISGLATWLDFSDVSTLFQDTGRTTPVTADAQLIKGVTDKSGSGNHASEATNAPKYKVNIQNGRSVARFDNSPAVNTLTTACAADATKTHFVVIKATNLPNPAFQNALIINSVAIRSYSGLDSTNWGFNPPGTAFSGSPTTAWNILAVRTNSSGSFDLFGNGGTPVNSTGHPNWTTGTSQTIGGNDNATQDVTELLHYDSALSNADINRVGNYLANKWGLPWTNVS